MNHSTCLHSSLVPCLASPASQVDALDWHHEPFMRRCTPALHVHGATSLTCNLHSVSAIYYLEQHLLQNTFSKHLRERSMICGILEFGIVEFDPLSLHQQFQLGGCASPAFTQQKEVLSGTISLPGGRSSTLVEDTVEMKLATSSFVTLFVVTSGLHLQC